MYKHYTFDNVSRYYYEPEGLEWQIVTLDDGRDVMMLLPIYYEEKPKCRGKCTRWECVPCYETSFMNTNLDKVKCWADKISPRLLARTSNKKFIFLCDKCNHYFLKSLGHIHTMNSWCQFCSKNRSLCDDPDCEHCFKHSFASHPKSKYWSINNRKSPREFTISNAEKAEFKCECGHKFMMRLAEVTTGQWCPYCAIPSRLLCDDLSCKQCLERSFASHNRSKFWSSDNNLSPRFVFKKSNKKFKFLCDKNCDHTFLMTPVNIATQNQWCPKCNTSKRETLIADYLKSKGYNFETEYLFPNSRYRYDFKIGNKFIEYDGKQHFIMNGHFHKTYGDKTIEEIFEERQEADKNKNQLIINNNKSLLRLDYTLNDDEIISMVKDYLDDTFDVSESIYYSNLEMYTYLF